MTTDRFGMTILEHARVLGAAARARRSAGWPSPSPATRTSSRSTSSSTTARSCSARPRARSSPAAVLGTAVAFEVDGYDADAGEAWSVVLKGRAREIEAIHDVFDALDLPLFPWHASPKHRFVRIVPDELTGRRFTVVEPPAARRRGRPRRAPVTSECPAVRDRRGRRRDVRPCRPRPPLRTFDGRTASSDGPSRRRIRGDHRVHDRRRPRSGRQPRHDERRRAGPPPNDRHRPRRSRRSDDGRLPRRRRPAACGAATSPTTTSAGSSSSQNITFPDEAALVEEGRTDLVKYAGEQVTTGQEAEAYASYIDGHLEGIADGATYADLGGPEREARTALQAARDEGADEATVAELQATYDEVSGQRNSLFKGETLRGLLLTSYAWATVGTHRRLRRLGRLRRRRPDGGPGDARTAPPSPAGHGFAGRRDLITVRRPASSRRGLRPRTPSRLGSLALARSASPALRGRRARGRGRGGRRGPVG